MGLESKRKKASKVEAWHAPVGGQGILLPEQFLTCNSSCYEPTILILRT